VKKNEVKKNEVKKNTKPDCYALSVRWGDDTHHFLHFYSTIGELETNKKDVEKIFIDNWKLRGARGRKPCVYKWNLLK